MEAVAVITGGTSGIGAAYAQALAVRGYDLVITGRRAEKLESVASQIKTQTGRRVETVILELGDGSLRAEFCNRLRQRSDVEILVNNAGFGLSAQFDPENAPHQLQMLEVHVRASLELIESVLPQMLGRRHGTIINVSSLASFFPMPRGSVYSASKAFLTVFSESLAMELHDEGIRVQALCPGMTRTDFHAQMGIAGKDITQRKLMIWMSPERVVFRSLRAMERGRVVCIPGIFNFVVARVLSHVPRRLYHWLVSRVRS